MGIFKDRKEKDAKSTTNSEPSTIKKVDNKFFEWEPYTPQDTKKKGVVIKPVYVPPEKTKLTIFLIENTTDVANISETISKIVKSLVTYGYVYIINYGSSVKLSKMFDASKIDYTNILNDSDIGDYACFSEALVMLNAIVNEKLKKVEELEKKKKIQIEEIEIVGIGKCIDNCSTVPKDVALDCFYNTISKDEITNKYFCLTEESFVEAAATGFRSIGAIYRSYV